MAVRAGHEEGVGRVLFKVQQRETPDINCLDRVIFHKVFSYWSYQRVCSLNLLIHGHRQKHHDLNLAFLKGRPHPHHNLMRIGNNLHHTVVRIRNYDLGTESLPQLGGQRFLGQSFRLIHME